MVEKVVERIGEMRSLRRNDANRAAS